MFITPAFGSCDQDYKHDVLFITLNKMKSLVGLILYVPTVLHKQSVFYFFVYIICFHALRMFYSSYNL